ncbi:MAG: Hsp70 family protein, partial [Micromonosporaceae bacterium]
MSRHASAELHVPLLDREVHLTREEFEQLARPLVADTVTLTADTLRRSGVPAERLAGVFLVGGASRIPLVATMVHQGLRIAPTVLEQPELVVAEGAVIAEAAAATSTPPQPVSPAPPVAPAPRTLTAPT